MEQFKNFEQIPTIKITRSKFMGDWCIDNLELEVSGYTEQSALIQLKSILQLLEDANKTLITPKDKSFT